MENSQIQTILKTLGERVPASSRLFLVGGSALALLGSPRLTIDIDFVGDDISPNELHQTLIQAAKELKILVEPVPVGRFIPLPAGNSRPSWDGSAQRRPDAALREADDSISQNHVGSDLPCDALRAD